MSRSHVDHGDIVRFAGDHVNLRREDAKEMREQVWRLRARLEAYLSEHPDFALRKMLLSGSLAKGTGLKSLNDIDVACYVSLEEAPDGVGDLIGWLADKLRGAFANFSHDQVKPNTYSVTVTFKGTGLRVDVVPILYQGDPAWRGYLVSRENGEKLLTSIPMHLDFTAKRKKASPDDFAQVVRLIKFWVSVRRTEDQQFRFKSFMAELVVAHLADGGTKLDDYPSALARFFAFIATDEFRKAIAFGDYYDPAKMCKSTSEPIRIWDPVNGENNVAKLYTRSQAESIVEAALDAGDAIASALRAPTKGETLRYWRRVFGPSFSV